MMKKFGHVRATLAVAAIFCSVGNQPAAVVSGCPSGGGGGRDDVTGEPVTGCPCAGEAPSRYVNRTDVIKQDILRKLRMFVPPNASAHLRHLPAIPLLHRFIEQANNENDHRERNGNENENYSVDDDDDHVTAMTILALSQPGVVTIDCLIYEHSFYGDEFAYDNLYSPKNTVAAINKQKQ